VTELDNPIWSALTTLQAGLGERAGRAARFRPTITGLAGLAEPTTAALAELATLVRPGEWANLLLDDDAIAMPPVLEIEDVLDVPQMVHDGGPVAAPDVAIETLGDADAAAMQALAALTRPGYFSTRTHELGTFLGIRHEGRVVAMAGQRLHLRGFHEVTSVCTHPDHLGRGHGAALVAAQIALMQAAGDTCFLHVLGSNQRAIALYERLGFRIRRRFRYVITRPATR
jgi:ribosomal protein S18 acetylase RimI-like enzyme